MASVGGGRGSGEPDEDDIEMLRQAALRTIGMNRNKRTENHNQTRMRTKGNLIEIQPAEMVPDPNRIESDDFLVEEFVIEEGSDVSINSSDCDEVIEEVIVSDVEDEDESVKPPNQSVNQEPNINIRARERSRSRSLSSNHQNSDDDSDAVSIQSSYSLILDDDITSNEVQSVEAKFLSRKVQKQQSDSNLSNDAPLRATNEDPPPMRRQNNRDRSPLPFRTGRRSRSRERELQRNRSVTRKSRSRSRSPLLHPSRRRNHSPGAIRGGRRPYRTNSNDRNHRRRRTRSRSLSSPSPRPVSNRSSQNSRRPGSRPHTPPIDNKDKNRSYKNQTGGGGSSSSAGVSSKSTVEDVLLVAKTIKNDSIVPEEIDRLEKRRRKFEGDAVASNTKVIKIKNSDEKVKTPATTRTVSNENSVLKEKVQKAGSRRSVELVSPASHSRQLAKNETESGASKPKSVSETGSSTAAAPHTSSVEDDQEDLRTRLIKKKLEKMQQSGSGGSSSASPTLSSVVVVSMGSQRIFSQALKNSQRPSDSSSSKSNSSGSSSSRNHSGSKSPQPSTESSFSRSQKPKSQVSTANKSNSRNRSSNSGSKKHLGLESSSTSHSRSVARTSTSSTKGSSKSGTSNTKRVVSVTYS